VDQVRHGEAATEREATRGRRRLRVVSTTELRAFRRCPRKHHFAYGLRIRAVYKVLVLRFGILFHLALEAWWRAMALDLALQAMAAHVAELEKKNVSTDPFELAKARALITGYHHRWRGEPFEVLGIEVPFETDLVNPRSGKPSRTYRLGGRLDALVRDVRGRVLIVESKTCSDDIAPGSDYWRRLRLDTQVDNYFVGARALGHDAHACLYDVIRKPTLRPLKRAENIRYRKDGEPYANQRLIDETPEEYQARLVQDIGENPDKYYARGEIVRLQSECDEAAFDLWQTTRTMREAERAGRHPRNADACIGYGSVCEYFGVCTGEASLDDRQLFRVANDTHEELPRYADDGLATAA